MVATNNQRRKTLKKQAIVGLAAMMILAALVTSAAALETSYDIMPHEGPYDQPVLIWVRTDPLVTTDSMVLYVFIDNVPIHKRVPDIALKNGNYRHSWDLNLNFPENLATEGAHMIKIWIEEPNGEVTTLRYSFTITDGLPPIDAWTRFIEEHPEFLESIQGPVGEQGETGLRGVEGMPGIQGKDGPISGPGPMGKVGPVGPEGPKGEPGRIGWVYLVGLTVIVMGISFVTAKGKELVS